jgi:hypothetical protein
MRAEASRIRMTFGIQPAREDNCRPVVTRSRKTGKNAAQISLFSRSVIFYA